PGSVSCPRSSNRTGGVTASGSRKRRTPRRVTPSATSEHKLGWLVLRPHDCVIECPPGFLAGKIPLDHDLIAIRATVPSSRFPPQRGAISDPAATQALPGVQADGDLCLVQPTAMLRGVVHREPLPQPLALLRAETLDDR